MSTTTCYKQFLPTLSQQQQPIKSSPDIKTRPENQDSASVTCTCQTSDSISSSSTRKSQRSLEEDKKTTTTKCSSQAQVESIVQLAPAINNSALVRQKVSAKETLALASMNTAASLPLVMGAKSVVCEKHQTGHLSSCRANMVSVVRPVVHSSSSGADSISISGSGKTTTKQQQQLEGVCWPPNAASANTRLGTIMDDFMALQYKFNGSSKLSPGDELLSSASSIVVLDNSMGDLRAFSERQASEQEARQQMILFRREEYELNRNVRRQHRFILAKLEERRRQLQIVHSVWHQKDFKLAIETLLDLYQQGLIYSQVMDSDKQTLSSLNTCLLVDALSVITLRPKLWTLDVSQLLLPVIVSDLLSQDLRYENYIELGLKSVRLILTSFSQVIVSTLQLRESTNSTSSSFSKQIDLSFEERTNKCLNCLKLLMEAKSMLASRRNILRGQPKWSCMLLELDQLFARLESSLESSKLSSMKRR